MKPVGLFIEHPIGIALHLAPKEVITHQCLKCGIQFTGRPRHVLYAYREHVESIHYDMLEDCGCCGCQHFLEFSGDCREDFERF